MDYVDSAEEVGFELEVSLLLICLLDRPCDTVTCVADKYVYPTLLLHDARNRLLDAGHIRHVHLQGDDFAMAGRILLLLRQPAGGRVYRIAVLH